MNTDNKIAALSPTAVEGFVLVPREATEEMLRAGEQAYANKAHDMASVTPTEFPDGGPAEACYRAMLSAAPAIAPAVGGITAERLERHKTVAAECPPATEVVLLSSLKRMLSAAGNGGAVDDARKVATSLIEAMIDISEHDIYDEGREWSADGMRAVVGMAYEAIRQNEWFFGGRPKPALSATPAQRQAALADQIMTEDAGALSAMSDAGAITDAMVERAMAVIWCTPFTAEMKMLMREVLTAAFTTAAADSWDSVRHRPAADWDACAAELDACGDRGVDPPEPVAEPDTRLPLDPIPGQARAWQTVFNTLEEVVPGWREGSAPALDKACATIRRLAGQGLKINRSNENAVMLELAGFIASSAYPDDERLVIADVIARYLRLDWPAIAAGGGTQECPDYSDGCDSEGFVGGCVRMGHTPETCPRKHHD